MSVYSMCAGHLHQNHILIVKHGGKSIMVCSCFADLRPGCLAITIIEGTINSKVYLNILQENVRRVVYGLKLKRWVKQQDNYLTHTSLID